MNTGRFSWPNLPNPGPGDCDPHGVTNSCFWEAKLECSTGITRGQTATCWFSIEPAAALDYISGWSFVGEDVNVTSSSTALTWLGPVVQSGEVRVDFRAGGRDAMILSYIHVLPRDDPNWTWLQGGSIQFTQGGVAYSSTTGALGVTCRQQGCGQWLVQPTTFSHNSGYTHAQVPAGGPNALAWYVASVTADIRMASALNPEMLPGGILRPQSCGAFPEINAWDFNHFSCGGGGGSGWGGAYLNWAWDHEARHAAQAAPYIAAVSRMDLPREAEPLASMSSQGLRTAIQDLGDEARVCVHAAVLEHNSHPGSTFSIWRWGTISQSFFEQEPGIWWSADPKPAQCN